MSVYINLATICTHVMLTHKKVLKNYVKKRQSIYQKLQF